MVNPLQSSFYIPQGGGKQPTRPAGNPFQTIPGVYGSILTDQDILALSQSPQKKSGFLKKLLTGTAVVGGTILGGIAFKRYFPGAAAKVGSVIPDLVKKPFSAAAGTGIGQKAAQVGDAVLSRSESLLGKASGAVPQAQGFLAGVKGFFGKLIGKG